MSRYSGVYAALLTPRDVRGELDLQSFTGQFHTPAASGLSGYAVAGATGEFTFTTESDLEAIMTTAREAVPDTDILCGIGACDVRGTVARARIAARVGATAVLLPMPSFFPYRQDDLIRFVTAVADEVQLPVLLYNLPQFTSGLQVETVMGLLQHNNIVGIKDSSGSLDIVRAMTAAQIDAARLIGNDGALCAAMEQGLCDGVVSGVACTLPELMTALFATQGGGRAFATYKQLLDEFIEHLGTLPTPWGLKVTSAVRGFTHESYPFPLSEQRTMETDELRTWFSTWVCKATNTKAIMT